MKKTHFIILLLLVAAVALAGCSGGKASPADSSESTVSAADSASNNPTAGEELTLTLEQLAAYNGQNGQPAYIAVDGVIYDVTNVPEWKNGLHNGFTAGLDLTEAIKNTSPHGVSKLSSVPAVGKLAD